MKIHFVMCEPDKAPKLVSVDKMEEEMPDGCTGFMGAQTPSGVPCLAMMPCNEMRPERERLTDYLSALSYAMTYVEYGKLEGIENFRADQKDALLVGFHTHMQILLGIVRDECVRHGYLSKEAAASIIRTQFGHAHDNVCDDPVCRADMHKRIFGVRGTN